MVPYSTSEVEASSVVHARVAEVPPTFAAAGPVRMEGGAAAAVAKAFLNWLKNSKSIWRVASQPSNKPPSYLYVKTKKHWKPHRYTSL